MIEAIITAIVASCAYLFTLSRIISLKRILRYSIIVDVIGTIMLAILFNGTYAGMLTAVFGGLFIAIFLTLFKKITILNRLI